MPPGSAIAPVTIRTIEKPRAGKIESAPRHRPQFLQIPLESLVRRYADQLLSDVDADRILAAFQRVEVERKAGEQASWILHQDRVRTASIAAANEPTAENRTKLSKLRAVEAHDLFRQQEAAFNRMRNIIKTELSPLQGPIYARLAAFLEVDAKLIEGVDAEFHANFFATAKEHPIVQSLRSAAQLYRRMAEYAGRSDEHPSLLAEIVKALKDKTREKPDLSLQLSLLPKDQREQATEPPAPAAEAVEQPAK